MRMSTGDSRDEQLALDTIAAAVAAGITVFDTAHSYGDNESSAGASASRLEGGSTGADRDQGRHEAGRREVDPGRPR